MKIIIGAEAESHNDPCNMVLSNLDMDVTTLVDIWFEDMVKNDVYTVSIEDLYHAISAFYNKKKALDLMEI